MTSANRPTATAFISAECAARVVRQNGLANTLKAVASAIHEDFLRWEAFDKSARVAAHSADGVIELMPVSDDTAYAFKYVNGHPKNQRYHLPTVMAFGVLADVATGLPTLVSELTLTTAIRTAAMSALAASTLARPRPKRMALIGNGAQSEFQALAFRTLLGVEQFHVYDVDSAATDKLLKNLAVLGLKGQRFASIAEAVRGTDIVTTVTADKCNATILTPEMIEPGMHINAVGGDCPGKTELHRDILANAAVFVEYEPQTRIEGDIQQMPADFKVVEIYRAFRGEAGRPSSEAVTVFDSVGFALEDYSALRTMFDLAKRQGELETISLIPDLDDPKNLFAHLHGGGHRRVKTAARVLAA